MEGQSAAKLLDHQMIGMTYGVLKCIEYIGSYKTRPNGDKRKHFKAICTRCDNEIIVRKDRFFVNPKSCKNCSNSLQKEIADDKYLKLRNERKKYSIYKGGANSRNIPFMLSFNEFCEIIKNNCYYCNSNNKIGVDRLDNTSGYLINNCVPCCTTCNIMKNAHTFEFFKSHIIKIYGNLKEGSTTISKESTLEV